MKRFEMRQMTDDKVYDIGHVSGSFAAFRMKALDDCGTFDSRFFLYFEDTDISRRIHKNTGLSTIPLSLFIMIMVMEPAKVLSCSLFSSCH